MFSNVVVPPAFKNIAEMTLPESETMSFDSPVYSGHLPDPFAFAAEGVYWAVGTETDNSKRDRVLPMVRSTDLIHWEPVGDVLVTIDETRGDSFWAPEVAEDGGRYYLYYAAGKGGHVIRVAVSDRPQGPYLDCGRPLVDKTVVPFSIDGHCFRDDDGQRYFFYAVDFADTENGQRAGTSIVMDRMKSMTELAGEPMTVIRAQHDWQLFQADREMYGRRWDWFTIEGPFVKKHEDKYYCFYSAGCFGNGTYGADYLVADSVLGPWRDEGINEGARFLFSIPGKVIGPGHFSILTTQDGKDLVVYHAWNREMTMRQMHVTPLLWTPAGPRCEGFEGR